jgi:hypothetical protein
MSLSVFASTKNYSRSDIAIKSLVRDYRSNNIKMPGVQRVPRNFLDTLGEKNLVKSDKKDNDGWPLSYKEDFIKSILTGMHIPSLTLRENDKSELELYDGGHRLRCLTQFLHNCFGVQVGNVYYMYNEMLSEEDQKIIKRRKVEDCCDCVEIEEVRVLSETDRRKFDRSTINTITYHGESDHDMIVVFNKLNNQAALSSGEKIYAGFNKIHEHLRAQKGTFYDDFKNHIELRALHRYTDMSCIGGLFNFLFILGNPEPGSTIPALIKLTNAKLEIDYTPQDFVNFESIIQETFYIIKKTIELKNDVNMSNIGFNIDLNKPKCKQYMFYTIASIVYKKYYPGDESLENVPNLLEHMPSDNFCVKLVAFAQLSNTNSHMKIFQKNTRKPDTSGEQDEELSANGVNNPNKRPCILARAKSVCDYITV